MKCLINHTEADTYPCTTKLLHSEDKLINEDHRWFIANIDLKAVKKRRLGCEISVCIVQKWSVKR